jgi:hypothetical protein
MCDAIVAVDEGFPKGSRFVDEAEAVEALRFAVQIGICVGLERHPAEEISEILSSSRLDATC